MSVVWELVAATVGGAALGAAGVYAWACWVTRPKPLLPVRYRSVSSEDFARLSEAFGAVRPAAPRSGPVLCAGTDQRGRSYCGDVRRHDAHPMGTPPPVDTARYTYVRGPVRNRDTDHG